jgi:hypothetical protein
LKSRHFSQIPEMQSDTASQELLSFCRFNARSAEKSPRFGGFQMRLPGEAAARNFTALPEPAVAAQNP